MSWNKISLFKFQQIDKINSDKNVSELDRVLFSTCVIYGMTEFELDNCNLKKATRLIKSATNTFTSPFAPIPKKKVGRFIIEYDITGMTLGQFIELAFFLSMSPVQSAHYILASVSRRPWRKNRSTEHRKKADYFLYRPITEIMGCVAKVQDSFKAFTGEYKSFFGLDQETYGNAQEDQFNKRYGWIFSASQVAEYERITLDAAMGLPIRQALNDLIYLKAKATYEAEQFKIQQNAR